MAISGNPARLGLKEMGLFWRRSDEHCRNNNLWILIPAKRFNFFLAFKDRYPKVDNTPNCIKYIGFLFLLFLKHNSLEQNNNKKIKMRLKHPPNSRLGKTTF